MRYLLALIGILLVIGLLFTKKLNLKAKFSVLLVLGVILGGGFALSKFEAANSQKSSNLLEIFLQGKNIKCAQIEVNSSAFNYENGTQSFVAKPEFKQFAGVVFSIQKCEK